MIPHQWPVRWRRPTAVRIPDHPGELVRMLGDLAALDVNVLDVVHERTSAYLHVDEVVVAPQVETGGWLPTVLQLIRLSDADRVKPWVTRRTAGRVCDETSCHVGDDRHRQTHAQLPMRNA